MPPVGFEPTISLGERAHTNALDRASTGIASMYEYCDKIQEKLSGITLPFEFEPAVVFTRFFNINKTVRCCS
jgi:hypothetical protein